MKANHSQKYAGKTSILQYALALMVTNGGVTTNEVKLAMRNDNFWIRQSEVSIALNELSQENKWDIAETGLFRIYSLPGSPRQDTVPQGFVAAPVSVGVVDDAKAQHIGNIIKSALEPKQPLPEFTDTPKRGDFFAFDYSNLDKPEKFVTGARDRNAARYFYAKVHHSQYRDVGANEIG